MHSFSLSVSECVFGVLQRVAVCGTLASVLQVVAVTVLQCVVVSCSVRQCVAECATITWAGEEGRRLLSGGLEGAWRAHLLPNGEEAYRTIYACSRHRCNFYIFCVCHLLFVYEYTTTVFGAFSGVLNIIICVWRRGVEIGVFQMITRSDVSFWTK
jgi:hypothetical protein